MARPRIEKYKQIDMVIVSLVHREPRDPDEQATSIVRRVISKLWAGDATYTPALFDLLPQPSVEQLSQRVPGQLVELDGGQVLFTGERKDGDQRGAGVFFPNLRAIRALLGASVDSATTRVVRRLRPGKLAYRGRPSANVEGSELPTGLLRFDSRRGRRPV